MSVMILLLSSLTLLRLDKNNFKSYIPSLDELPSNWPEKEDPSGLPSHCLSPDCKFFIFYFGIHILIDSFISRLEIL